MGSQFGNWETVNVFTVESRDTGLVTASKGRMIREHVQTMFLEVMW